MQPLQQQRPAVRVGAQQPHRAVAAPPLQPERLVLALVVGEGELQHRGLLAAAHRHHQRAVAMGRLAVDDQPPLLGHLAEQPRQPSTNAAQSGPRSAKASTPGGSATEATPDGGRPDKRAWTTRTAGFDGRSGASTGGCAAHSWSWGDGLWLRACADGCRGSARSDLCSPSRTRPRIVVAGLVATDDPPATCSSPPRSPCWSPGPPTCTGPGWCSRSSRTCPGCSWPRPPRPRSWSAPARPGWRSCVLALACLVLAHTLVYAGTHVLRRGGRLGRRVVIVGTGDHRPTARGDPADPTRARSAAGRLRRHRPGQRPRPGPRAAARPARAGRRACPGR